MITKMIHVCARGVFVKVSTQNIMKIEIHKQTIRCMDNFIDLIDSSTFILTNTYQNEKYPWPCDLVGKFNRIL